MALMVLFAAGGADTLMPSPRLMAFQPYGLKGSATCKRDPPVVLLATDGADTLE